MSSKPVMAPAGSDGVDGRGDRTATAHELTGAFAVALAVALHAMSFAYLAFFTRDRADWTIGVFHKYGVLMQAGRVPYRDFTMEYPPLAAPLFWLPARLAHGLVAYRMLFALDVLAFDLCGAGIALWALRRCAPRVTPWGVVLAQPLWLIWAGRSLVFDRFDLPSAVLALLAVALVAVRKKRTAWAVLGLAIALKLYPVVLLPLVTLATWRRPTVRRVAGDLGACAAAIIAPSLVITRGDAAAVARFLTYHVHRGLEIETVYSSALLLGHLLGQPAHQIWEYGGNDVVSPATPLLVSLTLPLSALALGFVYVIAWRDRRAWEDDAALIEGLVRLSAAAILAFMLAGKVLSPQYVLWLYPLVALLDNGRLLAWTVYGLALLLSQWIFPEHYYRLVLLQAPEIGVLLARNGLLLALGALILAPLLRRQRVEGQSHAESWML